MKWKLNSEWVMPDANVVNKSTNMILNINNANNYLKPQAIEHKKIRTCGIGNPCPGLGQAQKCGSIYICTHTHMHLLLFENDYGS